VNLCVFFDDETEDKRFVSSPYKDREKQKENLYDYLLFRMTRRENEISFQNGLIKRSDLLVLDVDGMRGQIAQRKTIHIHMNEIRTRNNNNNNKRIKREKKNEMTR